MSRPSTRKRKNETYETWQKRVRDLVLESYEHLPYSPGRQNTNRGRVLGQSDLFLYAIHRDSTTDWDEAEGVVTFFGPTAPRSHRPWFRRTIWTRDRGFIKTTIVPSTKFYWDPQWGTNRTYMDGKRALCWKINGKPPHGSSEVDWDGQDPHSVGWVERGACRRLLTNTDAVVAHALRREGKSIQDIAEQMGCSVSTMYRVLPSLNRLKRLPEGTEILPLPLHKPQDLEEVRGKKLGNKPPERPKAKAIFEVGEDGRSINTASGNKPPEDEAAMLAAMMNESDEPRHLEDLHDQPHYDPAQAQEHDHSERQGHQLGHHLGEQFNEQRKTADPVVVHGDSPVEDEDLNDEMPLLVTNPDLLP